MCDMSHDIIGDVISRKMHSKYPFVSRNIRRVHWSRRVRHSPKKNYDLFMHCEYFEPRRWRQTCYSSTSAEALAQREAPIRVSGIICRHISAGHLNCNTRFSPHSPLHPPTATPRASRRRHYTGRLWHIQYRVYLCAEPRVWRTQKDPSKD